MFALEVGQDLLNHHRVFDAGGDLDAAAAGLAALDVDIEYALEALSPSHRYPAFSRRLLLALIGGFGFVAPAAPRRRHPRTMGAVRCEHPVESDQIDPGLRHQGGQPGDEVQRLKDDVCGAIAVRRLELITHVAMGGEREALFRHRWTSDVVPSANMAASKLRRLLRPDSDRPRQFSLSLVTVWVCRKKANWTGAILKGERS